MNHNIVERRRRDVTSKERCHVFHVSSLSQYLHLAAQTNQRSIIITRPDNTTEEHVFINSPRDPKKLILFSEAEPMAGEWRVCVEKGFLEDLFINLGVSMDFTALYYSQSDQEQIYLTSSPPPGCRLYSL